MLEVLAVGAGGFIGSVLRFLTTKLIGDAAFPFSTLIVNIIAGFVVGFIFAFEEQGGHLPYKQKLFLTTGMMGALSTFSTFNIQTINLFEAGKYLFCAGNVILNILLSFLATLIGIFTVRLFLKR